MIGDKIVINSYHRSSAKLIIDYIQRNHIQCPFTVSVAGESGAGKSEIAHSLKESLLAEGKSAMVLGQDDYFVLPPHSNHRKRMEDIKWVGPQEVRLELMDKHVKSLSNGENVQIEKPLVYFEENRIDSEMAEGPVDVVIAEGTYTTLLKNVDIRAFINRNYKETKKDRLARNRDQALEKGQHDELTFLEDVLEIEHRIIREHRQLANIVIPPPS